MDWSRYKLLCDTPNVCSRWLLEQTMELLGGSPLAERLREAMAGTPLPKPADHSGGPETDMFVLSLDEAEVRRIAEAVQQAARRGVTTGATATRGLGGFVEAWQEYLLHLERQPDGSAACSARS